ncbi:MAG: putative secreted pili protein [Moraxellaceae bacterium]|jgi:spore coat protein U-like protein|nr:putative secreted pili protein [Moraxellaceae bacterium]
MTSGYPFCPAALRALALALALSAPLDGEACSVGTAGVAFGAYDPFAVVPHDGVGSIAVECEAPYSVLVSGGGGQVGQRHLQGATHQLLYNLFVDAGRSVIWGDGSGGTSTVSAAAGTRTHVIYGRIPARQNVSAGAYSDSLIITVNF